jgi:hypothetical protein
MRRGTRFYRQMSNPIDKSRITEAFRELRKLGYFARQNYLCCQSCAWSAIPEEKSEKVVFYHAQDNDRLKSSGKCHLGWSGDGNEIVSVLNKHGVKTIWDGLGGTRIQIDINEAIED